MQFDHYRRIITIFASLPRCVCGFLVALALAGSVAAKVPLSQTEKELLRREIGSFNAKETSVVDALVLLARQEHVPLGIEYMDLEMLQTPVTVAVGRTTLGHAVNAILSPLVGYKVSSSKGVILISHTGTPSGRNNLLDAVLPEFGAPQCTLAEANQLLWMTIEQAAKPATRGYAGNFPPGNVGRRIGPFRMRNVTVRDVLNRIVAEYADAAWVVQVPPQLLARPVDGCRLWRILEYEEFKTQLPSQLLLPNLKKYLPGTSHGALRK